MSFAPPLAAIKRTLDPTSPWMNSAFFYGSNALAYAMAGSWTAYRFKGDPQNLSLAFLLGAAITGVISMGTIHEGRKHHWKKEDIKLALTAEDLLCDSALLAAMFKINKLAISVEGLGVACGLVAVDACFAIWDCYWSCKARSLLREERQAASREWEGAISPVDEGV